MAAMMKLSAAGAVNKGPSSSYYSNDKANPVFQSLDQELGLYIGYMKKRGAKGYKKPADESASRASDTLFELWNKFEHRLPKIYYQRKLLEIGDFLVSIKEYRLALWQCYGRYLKHFGEVNVEEIVDISQFKQVFFPSGFNSEDAGFTFRALMGRSICAYQVIKQSDPQLQNQQSVAECVQLLAFLRLVTQVILPNEHLCWLVYNGTVHIYSISRHLMSLGHSSKVLEFVLWACMCMESSVPLLAVRYLTWRATLYTAVCQCYYDCKAGHHAESFARRALTKINELSQLEAMSNNPESRETEVIFRNATVKMAIMVYRRTVFETRRKPKGLLRPKTRANLKDAAQLPWPRTQSEKLLHEMFEGGAAQILCLLETLNDTNRRTLLSTPPAADSEVELLDVYAELFMAAQEIIAGGGGTQGNAPSQHAADIKVPGMAGVVRENSLMQMAMQGEDGVPMSAVVRVIKLAYCYEQWDVFDSMVDNAISAIREVNDPHYGADEKILEIIKAYDKVTPRTRHRRLFVNDDDSEVNQDQALPPPPSQSKMSTSGQDEVIQLAEVLLSVVTGPYMQEELDLDIIVDACLCLWNKCKAVFQKYQTGSTDNPKYLLRMESPSKWVYVLDILHQVLGWCGLAAVDPALAAEVALRLALVFEASAALESSNKYKPGKSQMHESVSRYKDMDEEQSIVSMSVRDMASSRQGSNVTSGEFTPDIGLTASRMSAISESPLFGRGTRAQLLQAREILEVGLTNVSYARHVVALSDGKDIADVGWAKDLNVDLFKPLTSEPEAPVSIPDNLTTVEEEPVDETDQVAEPPAQEPAEDTQHGATAVWNMIRDLHLELIFIYHRICLKLASLAPEKASKRNPAVTTSKSYKQRARSNLQYISNQDLGSVYIEKDDESVYSCHSNGLSKALRCMQRALLAGSSNSAPTDKQKELLDKAKAMILQTQAEEHRLYCENTLMLDETTAPAKTKVPPAPILLCRTDTSAVFRPAPFSPSSKAKVAWYRIFARSASGANVKVRLNDYYLPGTGEEVPSFRCELRVGGLTPGVKYVFAVAAYTSDGELIGGSIGESSRPVLASHPLPVLLTWAYLCQVGYQVGYSEVTCEACDILWSHFVAEPPPPQQVTYTTSAQNDFTLTLHRLNLRVVTLVSPILLRMFLSSIFIKVDISVRDAALFCDLLCDKGPLTKGQLSRLKQCEQMLVGLELAGWLNESNLALQAVIQCYGLLAPMIYFKIPAVSVIQVLERCHTILQEIPVNLRSRRQTSVNESLHHMTACLTYHLAKVLRTWGQRSLASNINDNGRKMLSAEIDRDKEVRLEQIRAVDQTKIPNMEKQVAAQSQVLPGEEADEQAPPPEHATETGSLTLAALKKKKTRKGGVMSGKEEGDGAGNEELKALEAHMLRLSKQAQGEHELSGNEDPSILHAYIAYLPSKMAHKEVVKFKRRARYLEFFVQVASKAVAEGLAEQSLEWCEDAIAWLFKRNEQILGSKSSINKQPGVVTIAGDDPKKFAAAMVEYAKDKDKASQGTKSKAGGQSKAAGAVAGAPVKPPKKPKYKAINIHPGMTDAQRQAQEEAELKALQILGMHLVEMVHNNNRRKRFRKICMDEMPWRAHLNIVQGLSQFGVFLQRLEFREKMLGNLSNHMYKTSFLDQEWFTFETAGTLVVGWEGGPSRQVTRQESRAFHSMATGRASGIEMAAAAATGVILKLPNGKSKPTMGGLFPIAQEDEDTPRTYRSEAGPQRRTAARSEKRANKAAEEDPESALISPAETRDLLEKTFAHFRRAIVLTHRGHHWTLLQNACRALWNCTHTALLRTHSSGPDALLNVDTLRGLACQSFSMAADFLLDMLVHMQAFGTHTTSKKAQPIGVKVNSWTGGIGEERGGASLKFESPLDDISMVDMRWIRALVLRVLEMLYYEQKWERLADIALRFNALTDNRYVEQVNPLLVQAQRKIINRIQQYSGPAVPQPHFQLAVQESGGPITAKRYTSLQLHIHVKDEELSHIDPGAHIDPAGHDVYSGGIGALRLSCVPLDVDLTLLELREVLLKTPYTARAMQHSRRLLVLYLAGQMNNQGEVSASASRGASRVDFIPTTARPQPTMPVDLLHEEFLSMDDVQTSTLPRSQIGVVLTSYDKTIEMLLANNQTGLAAQAMRELGNLQFHSGNIRSAYKWWSESLDTLLGQRDVIKTWRSMVKPQEDISRMLLAKCGVWGCILGAVISSNIAQYIQTSDLGSRTDCCFLAGYFFKALFRSSLPHPTADRDYALYEIGEGCEVTHLIPGIDLMSDRFRIDGRALVSALRFVNDELARGRHYLFVLPLLSLYQYLTTFVCRDLWRCVAGRILKTHVLTELSLFSEAFVVLQRLLNGERLPHTADSNFRQMESRTTASRFDTSKPLLDPSNIKVLESVLDKRLSSNLGMLYGPHLTCRLSITQAHLYIALSDTIPTLPRFEDASPPGTTQYIQPHSISTMSRIGGRGIHHVSLPSSRASQTVKGAVKSPVAEDSTKDGMADDETGTVARAGKRFTESKRPVTIEIVKGTLLSTADQILSILAEIILENAALDKGIEALSAAELEMVVQCKLELAAIARQRHHAALAARIIIAAMQMLRDSNLFAERQDEPPVRKTSSLRREQKNARDSPVRLTEPESSQFQFQNFQSLSRLDARQWLQCRLALVTSMLGEVKGMGQVKGVEKSVKEELADIRQYCAEGVAEAEACGDLEMEAELLLQGVVVDMMEGVQVNVTKQLLEEVLSRLSVVKQLSNHGQLLQSKARVHMTDLIVSAEQHASSTADEKVDQTLNDKALKDYCNAQLSVLDQLELFGEKIEHYYPVGGYPERSSPVSPVQNLYLPHMCLLVQTKLRIGQAMSRIAARKVKQGVEDAASVWAEPLGVLTTGLHMSQVVAHRIASIEAELLLNIGKLQRQLVGLGQFQSRVAVRTLHDAITTSYASNHDLGLMRQAYLEIALAYLCSTPPPPPIIRQLKREDTMMSITSTTIESEEEGQTPVPKDPKAKRKRPKNVSSKDRKKSLSGPPEPEDAAEQEKRAAWLAIRCATAVGHAQRSRLLLAGSAAVSTQTVSAKPQAELPEFAVLDLVSAYIFGEKKRIYKNEIEEELAPLTEALEPPAAETYDDMLNKARQAVDGLSWVQILGYQSILQRISSTATITTVKKQDAEIDADAGDLGPEFDLGFISHAQFDISLNHDSVRSVLFSPMWNLRLMHMHQFLTQHLTQYASDCIAIYPPNNILLPTPPDVVATTVPIICQNYLANKSIPPPEATSVELSEAPPGVHEVTQKPPDAPIRSPAEAELCLQWYLPSLEDVPATVSQESGEALERRILLLYAINAKKGLNPLSAHLWVSFSQLLDLHDRLAVLRQRGEISLVDKVKKEPAPPTTEKTMKGKRKETRIKALSPKVKRDGLLEALLMQCMADVQKMFGVVPPEEQEPSAQEDGTTLLSSTVQTGSVGTTSGQPAPSAAGAAPAATSAAPAAPADDQPKQPEIPFDVSKQNMHNFERLFDPSFGSALKDAKMHVWFNQLFA